MDRVVPPQRFAQLDALRALAVVSVVASHTLDLKRHPWAQSGGYGVQLFFVLSGFLITGILIRARSGAETLEVSRGSVLQAFYIRRFLRIFPIYYLTVAVVATLGIANMRSEFPWHLAYLSNWHLALQGHWNEGGTSHFWSLAVEEQFYLIWPLVVLMLPRRALPWSILAMIVIGPLTRISLEGLGMWPDGASIVTPSALDSLGLGCLLAYARHAGLGERWATIRRFLPLIAASIFILGRVYAGYSEPETIDNLASSLWFPLVALWLVDRASLGFKGWLGAALQSRPLTYIGTISYGIYLFHALVVPVMRDLERRLGFDLAIPEAGPGQFVGVMAISVAAAALSWTVFEQPINRLKDLFPYVSDRSSRSSRVPEPSS